MTTATKSAQTVSDALAPSWYDDEYGGRTFRQFHAIREDAETDNFKEGVKARWPALAPDDALVHIGRDRNEEQAPRYQTAAQFRAMLETTWTRAERYGTHEGVEQALIPLGFNASKLWAVDVCQGALGWGGSEDWPSYFAIIAGDGHSFERVETWTSMGSTVWEEWDQLWDLNMTRGEVDMLKRMVMRWKDARSFPLELAISSDGRLWDEQDGVIWTDWAAVTWNAITATAGVVHLQLGRVWDWWDHYGFTAPTWDQYAGRNQTWSGLAVTE